MIVDFFTLVWNAFGAVYEFFKTLVVDIFLGIGMIGVCINILKNAGKD